MPALFTLLMPLLPIFADDAAYATLPLTPDSTLRSRRYTPAHMARHICVVTLSDGDIRE